MINKWRKLLLLKLLKELEEDRIHWFCSKCNNKAVDVLKLVNNLKESNEKLQLRVEKVENRLDNIENMKSEPFREEIRKVIRAEVYEAKEKEVKECNLVIKGIYEIDDVEYENDPLGIRGMQSDEQVVDHLLKNVLEVEGVEINRIERIKLPQREGSDKTKIMIVKTGSFYQKQKVLRNAKKLGGKGPWHKVFINKDMTKAEREQDFELRKELKERRAHGEKNLVIRRGEIVTKNVAEQMPYGLRRQSQRDPTSRVSQA